MRNSFFSHFPVPPFLAMRYAGLEIADTAVRFVLLKDTDNGKIIESFGEEPLAKGVVEHGYVKDLPAVAEAIKKLKKDQSFTHVQSVIPEEKAYLYNTPVDVSGGINLENAIEFSIEENVPLSVDEVVFDFEAIKTKDNQKAKFIVSVVPRRVVDVYSEVLMLAGLTPVGFMIESHAIARSVIPNDCGECAKVIVDLSDSKTAFYLVNQGRVFYSSSTPSDVVSGGAEKVSGNLLNKKIETDEKIKNSSFSSSFIQSEVNRLTDYWKNQKDYLADVYSDIGQIIVCGERVSDNNIVASLSRSLALPVVPADVWINVFDINEYIPPIHAQDSMRYAASIGVAIF